MQDAVFDGGNAEGNGPDERFELLKRWLSRDLRLGFISLEPVSGDASVRRYFRVIHSAGSLIAMDAPPDQQDCRSFLTLAWTLRDLGLSVPQVLEMDLDRGFLLLSDFGSRHYLDVLDTNNVESLYGEALDALERLQTAGPTGNFALPAYDRDLLMRELGLFWEWLVIRHLGIAVTSELEAIFEWSFAFLADAALSQPGVCVHRDYHSRNLMVLDRDGPGILDFQDAVIGPITYDLVSLLRDCYIDWPRARVQAWTLQYLQRPAIRELAGNPSDAQWIRWFDLMGIQRHLKASGIFARLRHRDGKSRYLADLPRTLRYVADVSGLYPELQGMHRFVADDVLPRLEAS